jgi:hypothetical protein
VNYPKGNESPLQSLIEEAASAMGIQPQDLRQHMSTGAMRQDGADLTSGNSGTGSTTPQVSGGVGLRRYAVTGGGVGVARGITGNIAGGWTVATQPIFVKARFARSGTLAAGSDQHVGFQNSPFNHGVGIGVFQSISAVNFSVVKCASDVYTGVDTGIAIDTAQHEFTLYRNTAGAWFWRIDNGALTSMTTTGQPTSGNEAYGHIHVTNAAAATALTLDLDYCFWASREAA